MAIAIKTIPVLTGDTAECFMKIVERDSSLASVI